MLIYEVNIIPFFILLMKKLKPREFIIIDQGHTELLFTPKPADPRVYLLDHHHYVTKY